MLTGLVISSWNQFCFTGGYMEGESIACIACLWTFARAN
jgi:hypothetical protein